MSVDSKGYTSYSLLEPFSYLGNNFGCGLIRSGNGGNIYFEDTGSCNITGLYFACEIGKYI